MTLADMPIEDLLAGRNDELNGARKYPLRGGGDEPDRLDEFDNRIDHTDVQDKYRLHYTRDSAERVLFKSVNIHDDLLR